MCVCVHTHTHFVCTETCSVAFVQTMYTVEESEGQVQVCVNMTCPVNQTGNVRVEVYGDETSVYIPPNSELASKCRYKVLNCNKA